MIKTKVVIIGGGLCGVLTKCLLDRAGIHNILLEARNRLGGRVHTEITGNGTSVEMGATWLGSKHTALTALLEELQLKTFIQELGNTAIYEYMSTSPAQLVQLPENEEPSFRIKGGSRTLINALKAELDHSQVILEAPVSRITETTDGVEVLYKGGKIQTDKVVSTLPPRLFLQNIEVDPGLPENLKQVMAATHTWMGESIKFGLTYDTPFWKEAGKSGTLFSNPGPVSEMYDHSDLGGKHFALKGFINPAYYSLSREERKEMVIAQLRRYYGPQVEGYKEYVEQVWSEEQYTYHPYEAHVLPHQHNGHETYRMPLLNGKLWLGGSETADEFPGYMDGAVRSARFLAEQIVKG